MKKTLYSLVILASLLLGGHIAFAQSSATVSATPAAAPAAPASNFVPLTNIPAITSFTGTETLTGFFNNLYKICIGVAATLAVLQIIRAGFMYMGGDSVTETKQARALIGTAIGGLVLVLSPVILFSIINPKILSLQIGISGLTPSTAQTGAATGAASGTSAAPTTANTQQYQIPSGNYLLLIEGNSTQNPGCFTLLGSNYSTQSACQTAMSNLTSTVQSMFGGTTPGASTYNVLYNCTAPANGAVSVSSTGLCSSQPYFGGT